MLANVFHYGQALFEGFKGFHTKQGDVCLFADRLSWARMNHGCRRFRIPEVPVQVWDRAVHDVVKDNIAYVPSYGTNGALYVRPFIFGSGPRLGLGPSPEYTFVVFVNPVGSYYKNEGGAMQALDGLVNDSYDRAAPLGCGDCKAAGNYAADLESMYVSKRKGYPISLYLDAVERRYVEEFNTSNFVAITKDGKYITPDAPRSVLDSNTNKVLLQLASDMSIPVEPTSQSLGWKGRSQSSELARWSISFDRMQPSKIARGTWQLLQAFRIQLDLEFVRFKWSLQFVLAAKGRKRPP
ncbi:BCAT5 [Symbiodinium pilosum]|uniref:BCAT5 protein n=1 Tax=Symbiodinium pilosum TaxID=2952 RepID=A0A812PF49_SYMPI|nr:BCAT5 [Symbiodinium pilosum]